MDSDHGENEEKEKVDNENVEHVLERDHDTIKDSFQRRNSVDHFQGTQNPQQLHRFELCSSGGTSESIECILVSFITD